MSRRHHAQRRAGRGHALGAENAGAIDVGAACSGWLAALRLAAGQVEAGRADRVLVIGAELLTRITNFDDPKTAALFGSAGRRARRRRGRGRHRPDRHGRRRRLGDRIAANHDDRVLAWTATRPTGRRQAPQRGHRRRRRAGLELEDIDLFVYHQANGRIIRAVGERLDLEPARVADYVAHMANTSAASIPLTLSLLRGQAAAPRPEGPDRRHRRGLHLGRRRHRVGGALVGPPRERRTGHRRLQGHRRGDREGAGRGRLARRGQLPAPTRRAPRPP